MLSLLTSVGYQLWVLPALFAIPVIGAIGIWVHGALSPRRADGDEVASGAAATPRAIALVTFAIEFVVSLGLWWSLEPANPAWQSVVDFPWIPSWGIRFTIGVDGISVMMILLTTFIMLLSIGGSWTSIRTRTHSYYALLLVMTTGMLGVFMALDLFLFYVMWEVMLIPMYFIIGVWGGDRRIYASIKFFIYTFLGSLLMLVAILYLWLHAQNIVTHQSSFGYDYLMQHALIGSRQALWLFAAFFVAFAVKVPMFPLHTWLPDAHTEAPTAGSVILAGIMLKMGTYGFLRFALPLFPDASMTPWVRSIILGLAVIGIIYGALVSMVQPDFKRLVAYSSVSHLGFVMLGIFALTLQSVQGALMVMINHGISTGALFLLIGMLYERRHTRLLSAYGGIARVVPMFAVLLTLVSLSSIGLPGTNGFVGEFLVLIGAFKSEPMFAFIATIGVILAACYLLWAIQRIIYTPLDKPENEHVPDLNRRELGIMGALAIVILWIGIYPAPILHRMERSANNLVQQVQAGSGQRTASAALGVR